MQRKNISVFNKLKELDATPDLALIEEYNQHFKKRRNPNYRLIVREQVRPCFFSGDIEAPGKVVTVSLNPKYSPDKTKDEQKKVGHSFEDWYYYCRFRFKKYESDASVHSVFKNLFKVIAPPEKWKTDKRDYLQKNLLNLDWCYYYSKEFPSFDLDKLPPHLQSKIRESWDTNMQLLIEVAAPRYIFVHGRAMKAWFESNTDNRKPVMKLENSRRQPCHLFMSKFGKFKGTTIFYLEHFINLVNQNITLKKINRMIVDMLV